MYGQLGDGTTTDRLTPVDVTGLSSGVTAIAAGGLPHLRPDRRGGVKCWGLTTMASWATARGQIAYAGGRLRAVQRGGCHRRGRSHTCALTDAGGVKCWGETAVASWATARRTDRLTPVDVSGLSSGVDGHRRGRSGGATPAPDCRGGVKCWGNNFGQLGDGTTTDRLTPVDVSGLSSGVAAIAAGGNTPAP